MVYKMTPLRSKRKKVINVGSYKFFRNGNHIEVFSGFGGTNSWNDLIEANGWSGVMLDVILVPRWRNYDKRTTG